MLKVQDPPDQEFWVPCANCGRRTWHKALTYVAREESVPEITWWNDYFTLRCEGCHDVSFLHESRSDDSWIEDEETGKSELDITQRLYPAQVEGFRKTEREYSIPRRVHDIYDETITAITSDLPVLAGVGIRLIVEAVAKQQGAQGVNLGKRIDSLKSLGFITATGAELLHDLRFMGNAAAHEVKAHTQRELLKALRVIDHLLAGVYVLPAGHHSRNSDA